MKFVAELGMAAPELGWVPSPSFALRRAAVLDQLEGRTAGHVLEVGCGSGALLVDLAQRGFTGVGVEVSAPAREIATQMLAEVTGMSVVAELPEEREAFDLLLSFEVLEHIEDDHRALRDWVTRLQPGGLCLVSVPAHASKWNVTDVLAGHFRRYERAEVVELISSAGLTLERITTVGWPATWFIERARWLVRTVQLKARGVDPAAIERGDAGRSRQSGVERSVEARLFPLYGGWAGRRLMQAAARLQRRFSNTDWGISYLAVSAKAARCHDGGHGPRPRS